MSCHDSRDVSPCSVDFKVTYGGTALNGQGQYISYQDTVSIAGSTNLICLQITQLGQHQGQTYYRVNINEFISGSGFKDDVRILNVVCPVENNSYDCLNGRCVKNTSNSGYFKSLEDCQKLCGFSCHDGKQCVVPNTFCPPGKVCLDSSEFNQISSLASQIKGEVC